MMESSVKTCNGNKTEFSQLTTPRHITENAIYMSELDWDKAVTVQPIGYRILIPVPALPEEAEQHEIVNWRGDNETRSGIVFSNTTDGSKQVVSADGTGYIVIGFDPEQKNGTELQTAIFSKIGELGGIASLTGGSIASLMDFIKNELGLPDSYDSNSSDVEKMGPQLQEGARELEDGRIFGLIEKNEKSNVVALYVDRGGSVADGPHAGNAHYEDGFVAVRIEPRKEGEPYTYRSVAPEAARYCYAIDNNNIADPRSVLPHAEV